jgi:hypothetical protein
VTGAWPIRFDLSRRIVETAEKTDCAAGLLKIGRDQCSFGHLGDVHIALGQSGILQDQGSEGVDAGIGGGQKALSLQILYLLDPGLGVNDDRLGSHRVDHADRDERRALRCQDHH